MKPLLYVYRVLLTGIHLMQTGEVEANLITLNASARLPYLPELIERKVSGPEQSTLSDAYFPLYEAEYLRLRAVLEAVHEQSQLREIPSAETRGAINELLVRLRVG